MGIIKAHWKELLLIILLGLLVIFFPFTNRDWVWINFYNNFTLNSIKSMFSYQFIPALIATTLSQLKLIRVIVYVISFVSLLLIIKNMTNNKNYVLTFITLFLFFLIKEEVIFTGFISLYGFSVHLLPIVFTLLVVYLILKDTLYKIPKPILLIFGLVSASFNITYSLVIFTFLSIHFIKNLLKNEKDKYFHFLYIGSIAGIITSLIYNIINHNISIIDLSEKLLHGIIPNIFSMDFIISLILISFLLFLSIKVYISNTGIKRGITIISLMTILLYSLSRILSTSDILNYILWVAFEISSLFILLHSNNKIAFKNRIEALFTVKLMYIIALLLGVADISNMLFIEIINIIVIIGVIDYIFPKEFMSKTWFIISVLILLLNIYLFRSTYIKTMEMNRYIKNHLECGYYEVYLPHKYYNSHKGYVLPNNHNSKAEYLHFLNLNNYELRIIIEDD